MGVFVHQKQDRPGRALTDGQTHSAARTMQRREDEPAATPGQPTFEQTLNSSDRVQSQLQLQQMLNQSPSVTAHRQLATSLSATQPLQRQEGLADAFTSSVTDKVSIKTVLKNGQERNSLNTGGVVQREVAVQIIPDEDDDKTIGAVNIIGRSPKPVGFTGMGSHISMWASLTDQVESRLIGKTAAEAINQIDDLVTEAKGLPGYGKYSEMTREQQLQQTIAQHKMIDARIKADEAGPEAKYLRLQQYIAAYFDWRNLIPLTTFQFGPATATKGQQTGLDILRAQEFHDADYEEDDLRSAVMATLDFATIDQAAKLTKKEEVRPDTPGMDIEDTYESRMADMIEQHLKIIESTYPKAFGAADMSEEALKDWLKKKGVAGRKVILGILFDRYGRD